MSDFTLGQPVRFTKTLSRRSELRTIKRFGREIREVWKIWTTERWVGDTADVEARDGIVVGKRTLANGPTEFVPEEGTYFDTARAERFEAYLVAFGMRQKPVLVLPEHLEPIVEKVEWMLFDQRVVAP